MTMNEQELKEEIGKRLTMKSDLEVDAVAKYITENYQPKTTSTDIEELKKEFMQEFNEYVNDGKLWGDAERMFNFFAHHLSNKSGLKKEAVTGETSDGYHTFNELYEFRKLYNACLFNEWAKQDKYKVHKSWKHSDGELCFGGGWFIVVAELPTGQISNHYEAKDWDLFNIPEVPVAHAWDGHTAQDVAKRLKEYLSSNAPHLPNKSELKKEAVTEDLWRIYEQINKLYKDGWSKTKNNIDWSSDMAELIAMFNFVFKKHGLPVLSPDEKNSEEGGKE